MPQLQLNIVTAESETFSGVVDYVVAPGSDGQLTILPSHAALMTSLDAGEMRFRVADEEQILLMTGGFMEVMNNQVTVLADAAEREDEIDLERAEAAMRRAEERLASQSTEIDLERALVQLRRARLRFRASQRYRARRGSGGTMSQGSS